MTELNMYDGLHLGLRMVCFKMEKCMGEPMVDSCWCLVETNIVL